MQVSDGDVYHPAQSPLSLVHLVVVGTSSFLLLNFPVSDANVDLLALVQSAQHLAMVLLYTARMSLLENSRFSMSVVDMTISLWHVHLRCGRLIVPSLPSPSELDSTLCRSSKVTLSLPSSSSSVSEAVLWNTWNALTKLDPLSVTVAVTIPPRPYDINLFNLPGDYVLRVPSSHPPTCDCSFLPLQSGGMYPVFPIKLLLLGVHKSAVVETYSRSSNVFFQFFLHI